MYLELSPAGKHLALTGFQVFPLPLSALHFLEALSSFVRPGNERWHRNLVWIVMYFPHILLL